MSELHALFQHLLAHVCFGGGIVLLLALAVGVKHRAPFGRRRRVCLEGRFASGVSLLRRTDGTDTSIVHLHLQPTPGIPFFIRGKNPTDAIARAYITDHVDEEFQSYAWKIAKHETIVGLGLPVNGVITNAMCYNQFNPTGQYKELPNFGAPDGWGIGQIDRSGNEPSAMNFTTTREVYDWHASVDSMNVVLRDKRARYLEIIRLFRNKYQNDHSTNWVEPNVTTNLNGTVLTAREWSIITLYNGARGCDDLSDVGRPNESSPIHFDPTSSTWRLSTNVNNYAPSVISDAGVGESD